jgi:hypothetical protein
MVSAQDETVANNNCPNCYGTIGHWNVDYPWFSQYAARTTKQQRKLVWGTMSDTIRNPSNEGATDVTRTVETSVSVSWSSTVSGSETTNIQSQLSIPKTGSIGGSYTNTSAWQENQSNSSSITITTGRVCHPGYAIWERGYYYSKEIIGTLYRYNDNLYARYWCPVVSCQGYTKTSAFTDIYQEYNATFVFPMEKSLFQ